MAVHRGFKAVSQGIARKQHVPIERARAMLAAGTRRAGAAARRKNPRLSRVKGRARPALSTAEKRRAIAGMMRK